MLTVPRLSSFGQLFLFEHARKELPTPPAQPIPPQGGSGASGGKKRGRPEKTETIDSDRRFVDDWQASDQSLKEFAKARGVPFKDAQAITARERTRRGRAKNQPMQETPPATEQLPDQSQDGDRPNKLGGTKPVKPS